jgi:serine/threonine protein kinase
LVLTDFGIASITDSSVRYTTGHRTAWYSAPETFGNEIRRESDFWSLAAR